MILICEQCQARFLVASLLLGVSGRKVKCGVCGNSWFQPPGDDTYDPVGNDSPISFQDHLEHEDLEPIPEGVRPIPEGSSVPSVEKTKFKFRFNIKDHLTRENLGGGAMAAAIFALILAGMFALQGPLTKTWPPLGALFAAAGFEANLAGEGLIFDSFSAKQTTDHQGKKILTLSGNIVNLKKETVEVPALWATLQKSELEKGANFMVKLDKTELDPAGKMPFTAIYEDLPDDMKEVKIGFSAK